MMHSVGEIAVQVSGGAEHCPIPIRHAPIAVRAGVSFTRIRLYLGYTNGHSAIVIGTLKDAAEKFRRNIEYLAGEELSVRSVKPVQNAHLFSVSTPCDQRSRQSLRESQK